MGVGSQDPVPIVQASCAGARAGLDGCGKSHRDPIPGPSSPGILYRIDLSLFAQLLVHCTELCAFGNSKTFDVDM